MRRFSASAVANLLPTVEAQATIRNPLADAVSVRLGRKHPAPRRKGKQQEAEQKTMAWHKTCDSLGSGSKNKRLKTISCHWSLLADDPALI
jgi:hypothetical protein